MDNKNKGLSDDQIVTHKGDKMTFFDDGAKEAMVLLKQLKDKKDVAEAKISKESIEKVALTCLSLYKSVMQQVRLTTTGAVANDEDFRDDDHPLLSDYGASGDYFRDDFDF